MFLLSLLNKRLWLGTLFLVTLSSCPSPAPLSFATLLTAWLPGQGLCKWRHRHRYGRKKRSVFTFGKVHPKSHETDRSLCLSFLPPNPPILKWSAWGKHSCPTRGHPLWRLCSKFERFHFYFFFDWSDQNVEQHSKTISWLFQSQLFQSFFFLTFLHSIQYDKNGNFMPFVDD